MLSQHSAALSIPTSLSIPAAKMRKAGFTLLLSLVLCGILGATIYSAANLKTQSLKLRSAIERYTRGELIAEAFAGLAHYESSKLCVSPSAAVAHSIQICGISAIDRAGLSRSHIIDGRHLPPELFPSAMSDVFNTGITPCPASQLQSRRAFSARGRQLTPRSSISGTTCTALVSPSSENMSIDGYAASIDPRLAALGYIEATRVIVDQELLLIAGGDIFINRLELLENTTTVIASLTGVLVIDEINGHGRLSLVGREGVYIGRQNAQLFPIDRFNFELGNRFIPFQIRQ